MIPISESDEELFAALFAAARFGRSGPIIERLRVRYDEEWADPLSGFPYAMAMFAVLMSGREDLRDHLSYTEIIETLSDLLYSVPDHWLGRYVRVHTRTLLPDSGEHAHYIAAERKRAAQDVAELIDRQSRTAWQPWFACSYLQAARLAAIAGEPGEAAGLVRAAADQPGAPISFPSLGSILRFAFIAYRDQPELPEQALVGELMGTLFPGHPALRRVRAGQQA